MPFLPLTRFDSNPQFLCVVLRTDALAPELPSGSVGWPKYQLWQNKEPQSDYTFYVKYIEGFEHDCVFMLHESLGIIELCCIPVV